MTGLALMLAALTAPLDEVAARFEERTTVYTGGEYKEEKFAWRLLKPAKIEDGKKYPVILFLHGAGERGTDNKKQLLYLPEWISDPAAREKFPCFVVAPQCRSEKKWTNVDWGAKDPSPMPEMSDQLKVAMLALEETLKSEPCDTRRIYLTGLSMGGYGGWDLACRRPDLFAALVPVCGGGDDKQAAKLVNLPIWAWHGDKDNAVPVERSRKMIEAIKAAGGAPKYSELAGVGHASWVQAYQSEGNCLAWLFEQKKK